MWTPVVDVSVHQGRIDFVTMRQRGVAGVIMRATHGRSVDSRLVENVAGARAAGFADADLGYYTFINPKRGSPRDCAAATVEAIHHATGHVDTIYMLDIEAYATEPPDRGSAPVFGPAFAAWLREHIAAVRSLAPQARIIGYTNAAFWDGPVGNGQRWVGDRALAEEIEWIVPRYPVYPKGSVASDAARLREWLERSEKPPDPPQWAEWALRVKPEGPLSPGGVPWAGWQFSAGYNRQGRAYGCQSDDLDLNIVKTEAWQRWTNSHVPRPPQPDPPIVVTGAGVLEVGAVLRHGDRRTSPDGSSLLVHEADGEVAVYEKAWSSGTRGSNSSVLVMQTDGNLVLYDADGTALWNARTNGHPGAVGRIHDDGRLTVEQHGSVIWSSTAAAPVVDRRTTEVRPGEGFIHVARRALGDGDRWREIAALNGGAERVLHPGDVLVLP